MITRSKHPPECKDSFLKECAARFRRRGKAIRYHGELEFIFPLGEEDEWLVAVWGSPAWPEVRLELLPGNFLNLYVTSTFQKDHGRVIMCVEGLKVWPNAKLIVSAFETTIRGNLTDEEDHAECVQRAWREVAISTLD